MILSIRLAMATQFICRDGVISMSHRNLTTLLTRLLACFVLASSIPSAALAQNLLLITNNGTLSSQESTRKSQFETWGYSVTTVVDTDSQATYDAALSTADVVFVPVEVLSSSVGYKLRETTVGVVVSEAWLDNELGFSTSNPSTSSQTQILVTDNSHDVSAGLSTGIITIFSSSQNRVLMNGTEASGIEVLATSSAGDTVLAVLEAGATLANTYNSSNTAAGKRVRLPWGDSSFNFSALNSTSLDLLERALTWASSGSATSELLLHLRLDETSGTTASDSSENANHGTYINSPILGVDAIRREGATFVSDSGTFDRVDIPYTVLDDLTTVSVAWWMKTNKTGQQSVLSGARSSQNNAFLFFFPNDTTFSAYIDGPNRSISIDSIATDKWQHFVYTYDHTTGFGELFIDGKAVGTTSHSISTASIQIDSGGLVLAEEQDSVGGSYSSAQSFVGSMDDVRIYNKILSDKEIAEIHGLVGHWKLDETSGLTAYDSSGYADDGTHTGGVTVNVEGPGADEHAIAAEFDGSNDYVNLPDSNHDYSEGFAVSMWVKPTTSPGLYSWNAFLNIANGTYDDEIWLGWYTGYGLFFYSTDNSDGSNYQDIYDDQELSEDVWTHCIISIDEDGYATLYQDGVATESNVYVSLPGNANRTSIFLADSVWDENFAGVMQDVRLYNRPLLDTEIDELSGIEEATNGVRIISWTEVPNP